MRIAYLASRETLPGSPQRSPDAFEHDQMVECLSPVLAKHGATLVELSWDQEAVDWTAFDAVLIGSTWDYQDNIMPFLNRLAEIEAATNLFNSRSMISWNSRKTYLRDLADKGVATVPTLWIDQADEAAISDAFDTLGSNDLVVKRQIGANAGGQHRFGRGDSVPAMPEPMMVQPFLPAIQSEGEMSLIFIDGAFSHALIKSPADGDYRIQSSYGGSERAHKPDLKDQETANRIVAILEQTPLYARVDMVRDESGKLLLMELELIEPFLYPLQGAELGERLYAALVRRLS